jgi:hypothetical protein
MGLLDQLGQLANQFKTGQATDDEVHSTYDRVAHELPQGELSNGITHVFNSPETPPFEQMLSNLFNNSNPTQKAGLLNQILRALGPNAGQLLAQAGLGGLAANVASGGENVQVTPQQAQQVSPQDVQVLAQKAATKNPTIVDQAASFYAQHPTLVKSIGAGALALLMSRMSRRA